MQDIEEKVRFLRNSSFLHAVPATTLYNLAKYADKVLLTAGEKVFTKGDEGKSMYVVVDGCVSVHDNEVVLKHLHKGDVFGEIGAFATELRTASITAINDSVLLRLEQESLYNTLSQQPEAARSIIQALCEKERDIVHDVTESAIKVRVLERDMDIARRIQQSFLPENLPQVPDWNMAARLRPAREVAGDFYDFFSMQTTNRLGIVIGDVCDKGVGAALFMTLFRSLIRASSLTGDFQVQNDGAGANCDSAALLQHSLTLTNRYVATTHRRSNMFATVFFGLLEPETGELSYINAGHEAPLILDSNGIQQKLEPTGPVIGLFNEAKYAVCKVQLMPDDVLLAYTDGVTEAKNSNDELFSEDRLYSLVKKDSGSADKLVDRVLVAVDNFAGDAKQFDDITVVAVQRKKECNEVT